MAFPVMNSPFLPSIADAPFMPPKLKDMPVFNPGVRCYECEDGSVQYLSENEAINRGISCKVVDPSRCEGAARPAAPVIVGSYPVLNMGRTVGMARISRF